MADKKLYRSRSHKIIAGVCGGIAEYLNVDPTVVRIAWIVLAIFPFVPGIILYIIAWIVIPKQPTESSGGATAHSGPSSAMFGYFFIIAGILLLLGNLDFLDWDDWWHFSWSFGLPLVLIGSGVFFLIRSKNAGEEEHAQPKASGRKSRQSPRRYLVRSRSDRKVLGVCGGIARAYDIDPSILRVAFVFFSFWPFGLGLAVYLVLALVMPDERTHPQPEG